MKRSLCLVLVLILLIKNPFPAFLSSTAAEFDPILKMKLEQPAVEAFNLLTDLFESTPTGFVFPDDYSGAWIDNNYLNISLTSLSGLPAYKSFLSDYSNIIKFSLHRFSLNTLTRIQNSLIRLIQSEFSEIGITSSYSNEIDNSLIIEIADFSVVNRLKIQSLYSDVLENLPSPDRELITLDVLKDIITINQGSYTHLEKNLYGGSVAKTNIQQVSIGICGTVKNNGSTYPGFITCGHLFPSETTASLSVYDSNDDKIGVLVKQQFSNGGYGDWLTVKRTSNSFTLTNQVYTAGNNLATITGTYAHLPNNATFLKYGSISGYAYGTIVAWNTTKAVTSSFILYGLSKGSLISGATADGDSGGPYYCSSSTGYKFVGVHHGVDPSSYVYFTPFERFQSYFTPYTS